MQATRLQTTKLSCITNSAQVFKDLGWDMQKG